MLKDVVLVQKRELENRLQETYVERKLSDHLDFGNDLIKVITGPRRAGKSFYAAHLIAQAGSYGYINFDDERLVAVEDYDEIIGAIKAVYGNPRHLFFDEIQNLPRWEMFANRLQRQGFRLLVTGSNANLLSSELATHLTGRHTAVVLFPFSFKEYLTISENPKTVAEKKQALDVYLEQGGYPEPLLKKIDRRDYLRTLLQSTLYKDIIKRFKIRSVQGIEDLTLYLMSNIAREYSFNALAGVTKCRSVHTVDKYIRYVQEAYLLFSLPRFSFKVKEQAGYNKKIYCTDNGLAVASGFRFSENRGALYENLVAIALKKEEASGQKTIFYWKSSNNEEVDFVVKEGLHVSRLIQVCADISNPQTMKREMRALIKASQELNCNDLLLINNRIDRIETFKWQDVQRQVRLMPLWQWLEEEKI
jgi:predicted AAA+ superfamily ATPase